MKRFQFVLLLTISILLPVSYASAAQLSVPASYGTIQAAIDAAGPGDEVVVSDGTYTENINFSGKAITVTSVNGAGSTIIDGGGSGNVVTFENSEGTDSVLDGFTIQNGATGIYGNGVSPTISNCIITNNTGTSVSSNIVGGVYGVRSSFSMTNCTITNNTGWALFNNLSGLGGSLTMTECAVTANDGGVFFTGATLDVSKSIFTNNSNTGLRFSLTASGSGTGAASITNSLFAQNDSQDRAGGIWVYQATSVDIMNCTIADNTAQIFYGAGGIYVGSSSIPITITNSILTGNTLQEINQYQIWNLGQTLFSTLQSNFDISYTQLNQTLYSSYGPGNIYNSVDFVDSANGDYHLGPTSKNIDTGTSNGAPADDLDGNSRPQYDLFDMGAYEFTCPPDADGDGYYAAEGCGNYPIDCNDSNASIHPGKAEDCSDGIDNDCDGLTDSEELDCTLFCDNHDSEETGPEYSCSTGKTGNCYNGTRTCSNNTWSDCIQTQDTQPTPEICDNVDNDCDGRFNEGFNLSSCSTGLPGECAAGITRCQLNSSFEYEIMCSALTSATTETCDGLDNDCDGTVDNDLSTACSTGLSGICSAGTITCEEGGSGTWGDCIQINQPETEVCDGIDNDCNGDVDEGFDSDGDGTADCSDGCPNDPNKIASGTCGCGVADTDTDGDGTADCTDVCPADPSKILPGLCGCDVADCPQIPIIDPDGTGTADSRFGSSVALSDDGTIAVIGAINALCEPWYGNIWPSGRVFIFERMGSTWTLLQKLDSPFPYYINSNFGFSVNISGDSSTIIVGDNGARLSSGSTVPYGAAYIYVWDGSFWTLQTTLVASDAASGDSFGSAVTLSHDGNTAVVGARAAEETGDTSNKGAAYVFVRNGTTWSEQQRLKSSGANNVREYFGGSVDLSDDGNTLLVGAEDGVKDPADGIAYHGLAYVFTRNDTTWTQEAVLRASDYAYGDKFGISTSLSGDGNSALIGKRGRTDVGLPGAAYSFTRSEGGWTEQQKITPSDSAFSDQFGVSVALSRNGDRAIVGAQTASIGGNANQGAAYTFNLDGAWVEQMKHFNEYGSTNDWYGRAVAISGDGFTALAGAPLDEAGGNTNQGAVYVIPTIIDSINPARGAVDVPVNTNIAITFDQPMNGATFDDTSFTILNGGVVSGIVSYDDGSMTATFTPLSLLTNSTRYIAGLTGVEDTTGNVMNPFYWSFTTLLIDTDNDGLPDTIEDSNQNGIVDIGETDPNNPDTDGDGLSDGFEDANHNGSVDNNETDPRNFDSDGDGLNDGLEVNILGTDPTLADSDSNGILDGDEDSDGDGFTNAEEIQCSSDPADPNSKCVRFLPFLMLLLD